MGWAGFGAGLPASVARAEAELAAAAAETELLSVGEADARWSAAVADGRQGGRRPSLSAFAAAELRRRAADPGRRGYRWYSEQLLQLLRHAPAGAHCDVLCCPRSGHPPDLQVIEDPQ